MMRRLVTLSFALLLLGCGKVEEQKLLPWFRIRTSHAREAGIISFGSNKTEYFVKSGWSWKKLNVYGGAAVPLNPETVFFYSNGQAQIIHRGETKWRPAFLRVRHDRAQSPGRRLCRNARRAAWRAKKDTLAEIHRARCVGQRPNVRGGKLRTCSSSVRQIL